MKLRQTIEKDITWGALKDMVQSEDVGKLLHPGDELDITLENGKRATVVLAALLPETGDGTSGARFVFKDCIGSMQMNKTWTCLGGYQASEGRRHVLEDIYPLLPADLRAVIRPRKITETLPEGTVEYEDTLWLPSYTDVFGRRDEASDILDTDGPDDFQLPIFRTERARVKELDGETVWYWLRTSRRYKECSPYCNYTYSFCFVYTSGNASLRNAYYSLALAPAFDI